MARSHNRIILIGNLGKDAELRATPAGKSVATTSIAINDPAKKDESGNPGTEWYRLKIWGKTADNLGKFLLKGKQVYVEGRLSIQTWKDRDGKDRYTPEVSVDQILLLGSAGGGSGTYGARSETPVADDADGSHDDPAVDDIPF
jgi:single-strand DNA-binding protein